MLLNILKRSLRARQDHQNSDFQNYTLSSIWRSLFARQRNSFSFAQNSLADAWRGRHKAYANHLSSR